MTQFEQFEGLEENHDIANEAEEDLLINVKLWKEGGCNLGRLAESEFIFGPLAYLVEKGDHKFSPELLALLRENRILLSVNSDIKAELDKILDKN